MNKNDQNSTPRFPTSNIGEPTMPHVDDGEKFPIAITDEVGESHAIAELPGIEIDFLPESNALNETLAKGPVGGMIKTDDGDDFGGVLKGPPKVNLTTEEGKKEIKAWVADMIKITSVQETTFKNGSKGIFWVMPTKGFVMIFRETKTFMMSEPEAMENIKLGLELNGFEIRFPTDSGEDDCDCEKCVERRAKYRAKQAAIEAMKNQPNG